MLDTGNDYAIITILTEVNHLGKEEEYESASISRRSEAHKC